MLPPGVELHAGRGVGAHEVKPLGGLELRVHDLVGLGASWSPYSPKVLIARSPPKTSW